MNITDWMKQASAERKAEVAAEAGTTVDYLYQLSGGHREPSHRMAKRLHRASGGEMSLAAMRPDIWGDQVAA